MDESEALADDDTAVTTESVAGASDDGEAPCGDGEEIADERSQSVPDALDEALEAVENLDVRVKDEPLESVGDILMDDELRLQLEESIDMVVNEFSTPDNVAAGESFADSAEARNECEETASAANSSVDSMNDLEGTLDPDLQAVCDVIRMANSSPTMRRQRWDENQNARSSVDVKVKREPRDSTLAHLLSAVESLPAVTAAVSSSSSSSNEVDQKGRAESNPLDLLTMLSLDKKPSALSILPVKTDKNATEKTSTLPSVTIKSVPTSGNSTRPNYEEFVKQARRPPNLLPVDGKMFARSPDSISLPCSSSGSNSVSNLARMSNSSNIPPACCPTVPSRATDLASSFMLYNRAAGAARPSSCSYANYACRRMSPYPPPPYPSMSYAGMRSPASRIVGPFSVASVPTAAATAPPPPPPPPRPFNPGLSTFPMNGGCCTSVAPPVSSSMVLMNSKPSNYSALPPLHLNMCRMPLSPTSPSFARGREYASAFPDTTAASSDSLACVQPQALRPRSTWGGPQNAPLHGVASRALSLSSQKGGRRSSSMPMVVQPSNAPPYKNQLLAAGGSSTNFGFPATSQSGNVVAAPASMTNAYEDFPVGSGMPFQRSQCCFSSQIQCFNSACDNAAAQQHVSIIQHSTRLSNLKPNSMDSISSLLQYHSYFKKY